MFGKYMREIDQKLFWAIGDDDFNEVKKLLQEGADVNSRDSTGNNALLFAIRSGRVEMAKLLLSLDVINHNVRSVDGYSPVYKAVERGYTEVLDILLEKGVPDNLSTLLATAVVFGQCQAAEMLIDKGANPNATGEDGCCMLKIAIEMGYINIIEMLVAKGASVNAEIVNPETNEKEPLISWANKMGILYAVELLEKGAQKAVVKNVGSTLGT